MNLFGFLATPFGYVLQWIYSWSGNYFLAILLFTLLVRLIIFPLSIKTQKSQLDRARLAPRLERIQKKYANDKQKLQQKQQELYQKEGVSMAGGCLPVIVQMLVLISIITVIYKPLTYVRRVDSDVLNAAYTAVVEVKATELKDDKEISKIKSNFGIGKDGKVGSTYYQELYLMQYLNDEGKKVEAGEVEGNKYEEAIIKAVKKLENKEKATAAYAEEQIRAIHETSDEFNLFGVSLLGRATDGGFQHPNWPLWLLAVLSGLSALASGLLANHFSKKSMSAEQQQMAGCSTNAMTYTMPLFSLVISFTVPGGVVVYWIFSNLLALVQSVVLNKMYDPAKARAIAEAEYAERRRQKAEDRERLKQARLEEQAAWQKEENEKKAAARGEGKKKTEKTEKTENTESAGQNQPE